MHLAYEVGQRRLHRFLPNQVQVFFYDDKIQSVSITTTPLYRFQVLQKLVQHSKR